MLRADAISPKQVPLGQHRFHHHSVAHDEDDDDDGGGGGSGGGGGGDDETKRLSSHATLCILRSAPWRVVDGCNTCTVGT